MRAPRTASTRRCAAPKLYEEAGADVIFVESPESEAELERIGKEVSKPLLANMVEFGKTPRVEARPAEEMGLRYRHLSRPGLQRCCRGHAPSLVVSSRTRAPASGIDAPQYRNIHELMGFPEVWDFEKRWVSVNGKQFLEMLARLPARVWLQAILGLIGFVVLAVLGFAVIAGVAALRAGRDPGLQGAPVDPAACSPAAGRRAAGAPGPQGDRRPVRDRRPPQGRRAGL